MSTPTRPVEAMFDRASDRYDFLNTILSLGRDGSWRRALAEGLEAGERVLDVCCGSARSAAAVSERVRGPVFGVDASREMLQAAARHAGRMGFAFRPVLGDALCLPYADGTFDSVTIAWGLRNLTPETDALAELGRVLRPGGRLHILDSPTPEPGLRGQAHRWYLEQVVPRLGHLSPDAEAYRYLSRTVLAFGTTEEVGKRIEEAGYELQEARELFCGAAALWRARRRGNPGSDPLQRASSARETVQSATSAREGRGGG